MTNKMNLTVIVILIGIVDPLNCKRFTEASVDTNANDPTKYTSNSPSLESRSSTISISTSSLPSSTPPASVTSQSAATPFPDNLPSTQHIILEIPTTKQIFFGDIRTTRSADERTDEHFLCPPVPQGIYLPKYAIYMMGFAMLSMLLIIGCLIFTLYKLKIKDVEYKTFTRQESCISGKGEYSRQASGEKIPIIKTNQSEEIKIDDSPFETKIDKHINQNANSTTTLNIGPKIILPRNHVHPNSLLPEQMKKICEEVLVKKNNLNNCSRNTASNELSQMIESIKLRPNHYNKGLTREKSISTPHLFEVYDTLPAPVATKEENKAKVLNETEGISSDDIDGNCKSVFHNTGSFNEHKIWEENNKKDNINLSGIDNDKEQTDDEEDIEYDNIYDSPPAPVKKPIIIEDTEYLLPITSADSKLDLNKEPAYINAKKQNFVL